jgi:hypothetical protein
MKFVVAALLAAALLSSVGCVTGGAIGGAQYAPEYDYNEFRAALDGKKFQVILAGHPFPAMAPEEVARLLLPVMQANKPRVNLTFTYQKPAEKPHPDYQLYLVFNAANDLGSNQVCEGVSRFKPDTPGRLNVFGVYCRNNQPMSETTAWTAATGPDDPRVSNMFKDLFSTLFDDSQMLIPSNTGGGSMQ